MEITSFIFYEVWGVTVWCKIGCVIFYWQIYDAGDFSLLCSESSRRGERWLGGEFIGVDRVVVWSNEGRGYLYKLPTV